MRWGAAHLALLHVVDRAVDRVVRRLDADVARRAQRLQLAHGDRQVGLAVERVVAPAAVLVLAVDDQVDRAFERDLALRAARHSVDLGEEQRRERMAVHARAGIGQEAVLLSVREHVVDRLLHDAAVGAAVRQVACCEECHPADCADAEVATPLCDLLAHGQRCIQLDVVVLHLVPDDAGECAARGLSCCEPCEAAGRGGLGSLQRGGVDRQLLVARRGGVAWRRWARRCAALRCAIWPLHEGEHRGECEGAGHQRQILDRARTSASRSGLFPVSHPRKNESMREARSLSQARSPLRISAVNHPS